MFFDLIVLSRLKCKSILCKALKSFLSLLKCFFYLFTFYIGHLQIFQLSVSEQEKQKTLQFHFFRSKLKTEFFFKRAKRQSWNLRMKKMRSVLWVWAGAPATTRAATAATTATATWTCESGLCKMYPEVMMMPVTTHFARVSANLCTVRRH